MKSKESLWLKYLRWSNGITGPLDERQWAELERIGNNCFEVFLSLEALIILVSLWLAIKLENYRNAYWFLFWGNLLALLVVGIYSGHSMKHAGLFDIEIISEERRKVMGEIILIALIRTAFFSIIYVLPLFLFTNGPLKEILFAHWQEILIVAVLFFLGSFTELRKRIKIIKDDD
ncbi:DUF3278 domain-containing protein [Lactobacillus acetotolerans]|uniref:DUF3278 domain-containing protein n=1 Tax=Lactobacillus acetotolerans TaxID=1600 RepID=UPI0019D10400|nr:DUF3278 domain-containing protein [Lactobacillus acetotolerans]MBN7276276.1 DUF3278 domain-containing protein [Lactobacillus acetotolerans]